ncbi:c-type cytochrome [Elioraea sp.]|uniref:c-type cytochrome n=1 Tax=Elioraea sp. TaxID=2185103 RepID=UPI0025C721F3|nr:c-type cytochrome [Elioraea sp.]
MRSLVFAALAGVTVAFVSLASADAPRSQQVGHGARLFADYCAACHGDDGRAGAGYQTPIWGQGAKIARFENAMGLFEYNQMMMPFDDPTKLSDEDKWAISAYMLANHGTIAPTAELAPAAAAAIAIK